MLYENVLTKMCLFIADDELEKFIGEVLKASSRGISALRNATSEPNWTFGQALFFSTTVVTTIGIPLLYNVLMHDVLCLLESINETNYLIRGY